MSSNSLVPILIFSDIISLLSILKNYSLAQTLSELNDNLADTGKYASFTLSTNQSIPSATNTQITWGSKASFNGENFCALDAATGKIKILKTGMYQIAESAAFEGRSGGNRTIYNYTLNVTYPNDANPCYLGLSEFFYATAGTLLNTIVVQTSGSALNLLASGTEYRIRKAL